MHLPWFKTGTWPLVLIAYIWWNWMLTFKSEWIKVINLRVFLAKYSYCITTAIMVDSLTIMNTKGEQDSTKWILHFCTLYSQLLRKTFLEAESIYKKNGLGLAIKSKNNKIIRCIGLVCHFSRFETNGPPSLQYVWPITANTALISKSTSL